MINIEPRTAQHPSGLEIHFDPGPHKYLLDGEALTSVTTLIKQWFPVFDAEVAAKRKAEREGGNYLDLIAQWDKKRDEAAAFGSKTHLMAEMILRHGETAADEIPTDARDKKYLAAVKEALRRIALAYDVIETEKIVFSPDLMVAGTIDLLLRHRETGEFVIADWKTNREIKFEGYKEEKGKGPCAHLAHCNFNHYSLQVSTYGELLSHEGYVDEGSQLRGVLLHLTEKPGGQVICDYIKTKDFRSEAVEILTSGNA